MTLSQEELKRRILAARTLRNVSQPDLGDLFKADGLHKHDAGRIERGDKDAQRVHIDAFQRHLHMPDGWWDEPNINKVLGLRSVPGTGEGQTPRSSAHGDLPLDPSLESGEPSEPEDRPGEEEEGTG